MTTEELRQKLMARLDTILGWRSFLLGTEDRAYLNAVRGYVATMTDEELTRLKQHLPSAMAEKEEK